MPKKALPPPLDALVTAWSTSARVTDYMLENLDAELWRAAPPAGGRTIAEIVAHLHNVRRMYVVGAGGKGAPAKLDRHRVRPREAREALGRSAAAVAAVLEHAAKSEGRLPGAPHGAVDFFTKAITHEAHHRGQITMLARQLGRPLPPEITLGMWDGLRSGKRGS